MLSISLFLAFLAVTSAKNDFPNEVVVTSADVVNNEIKNIGKAGESYHIYACVDSGKTDDAKVSLNKQVSITDSTGKQLQLNDLRKPAKEGSIFLSDQNTVIGPISVRDDLPPIGQSDDSPLQSRFPYTIYLVSMKVPQLPVAAPMKYSTDMLQFDSDKFNGQGVHGITFLSADSLLKLQQFTISGPATIIPRGFDIQWSSDSDRVLDLTEENASLSHLTVFGPIATIFFTQQSLSGRIQLSYSTYSAYFDKLKSGSSISLLSPNWLSLDTAYSTPYRDNHIAFSRSLEYGADTHLEFEMSASSLKNGESVILEIHTKSGTMKQFRYLPSDKGTMRYSEKGYYANFTVQVGSPFAPSTYPRFIVKITSGASSLALFVSLIATLLFVSW